MRKATNPATAPAATRTPPPTPSITQRQLGLFRAVMLHLNLSRAAEATNTSQPTLSREIARLEQLLGFALFDRIHGRLHPTARALALMQEVERSFIGLEHIALRAKELRWHCETRLSVACLPALAHSLLPRALQQLAYSHPQAQLSVHTLESPWLEQALSEQRFDLGIGEATQAPSSTELVALLTANEVAVLPRAHPLLGKKILKPADFSQQRFISFTPSDPYRSAIDSIFDEAKVQRQMVIEAQSATAICAMVRQGLGVAIVNPLTALALQSEDVHIRPISVPIPFRINLLLPSVAAPHPVRHAMVQALHTVCKGLV